MGQYIEVKEKATPTHGLELRSHPYPLVGWTHSFLLSYHSSLCCQYNSCYWCCRKCHHRNSWKHRNHQRCYQQLKGILFLVPFHLHPIYKATGGCRWGHSGLCSASFQFLSWRTQWSKWSTSHPSVHLPHACSVWANCASHSQKCQVKYLWKDWEERSGQYKLKVEVTNVFTVRRRRNWQRILGKIQRRNAEKKLEKGRYFWKGWVTHLIKCCWKAEKEESIATSLEFHHTHCWWARASPVKRYTWVVEKFKLS